MKKIHLGLIGIATLFLTACTVGVSSNKNSVIRDTDSITNLTVTFDFNGGTYDSKTTTTLDVKPTSYWKYVKAHLTGTITPPEHTTFEGFSFAKDDPSIIQDSYVVKEDITVYAQYKAKEGEYCTVNWKDGETSKIIKTETYFEGGKPELKDIPYHEGKVFDHWEPAITPITKEDLGDSREYKAIYVPLKTIYTVTLDYDDGSEQPIHTQTVLNGKCAVKPEVTKEGYELKDWTYIDGGEGEFNFSTPITKDGIKIKANWVKLEPFLQSVTMTVTIVAEPTTISFSCDKDDKYMVEWGDGALDTKNSHDYQSGTYSIHIFGSGKLKSFKMTEGQSCLSEVEISNVESLAGSAFYSCLQLQTVTFAGESNLTSIGERAFYNCSSLTDITIPSSVTSIGTDAFSGCPESIFNTDGNGCKYLGSIDNQYLALIDSADKNVVINGNCRVIGNSAFYSCFALTEITIPSSVTSIGNSAFENCLKLQSVIFAEGSKLTSISYATFHSCSALTEITIPSSVTSIGNSAFYRCSQLQAITFAGESQLTSIGEYVFHSCSVLTEITIPSSVTSIGDFAFYSCSQLQAITFAGESQLTSIGDSTFHSCSALTEITIPSSVASIGDFAFYSCSQLQAITFAGESQLTSIGEKAFYYCSALTEITIPSSVTSINYSAFEGCSSLQTVTFAGESQLTLIDEYVFQDCSALTEITIPSSVTSINYSSFQGCSSLQTVTFAGESQLTSIGDFAFFGCLKLQTVDLTALNSVPTLGNPVFIYCHDDLKLYVKTNMLEAFKAADGWKDYKDRIVAGPIPSINTI